MYFGHFIVNLEENISVLRKVIQISDILLYMVPCNYYQKNKDFYVYLLCWGSDLYGSPRYSFRMWQNRNNETQVEHDQSRFLLYETSEK